MPAYADPAAMTPGLFLGSSLVAKDTARLDAAGITHIVNASKEIDCFHKATGRYDYMACGLDDSLTEDITRMFDPVNEYIDAAIGAGGVVFVHCQAGVSRSATLVIAYLMKRKGMSLKAAYLHVKDRKSNIQPNKHFFAALQTLDPAGTFSLTAYYRMVLLDMGFAEAPIEEALRVCDGDFDLALNRVLAGVYQGIEASCVAEAGGV